MQMKKKRRLFSLLVVVTLGFCVMYLKIEVFKSRLQLTPCKIEALDPWDVALKPFLRPPYDMTCQDQTQLMYVNDTGWLHLNETMADMHKIKAAFLKCVYQRIRRQDGDMSLLFDEEVSLELPVFIKSHVFRIQCSNDTDIVYDMAHFNPFWNEYAKPDNEIVLESSGTPSVLILGIDSVSRSHAIRNLQKSYKFLTDEFQTYDFIGYSKIGENTWPNLVPLLTGRSHRDFPLVEHLKRYADGMPLLWKEKNMKHIASFFAEDRPDISTFNYEKSGFNKCPTDFYYRPYTLAQHTFEPVFGRPLGKPSWDCYGLRNHFDLQIEYLKGFFNKYQGYRKLAYFWSNQAGHEDFTTLTRFDKPLMDFLNWLKTSRNIQNTILFILSDHGFRIGGASLTHIGRAENNKPWLMVHIPKQILHVHPWLDTVLKLNSNRLLSHYDTYQTVLDILNNKAFNKRQGVPVRSFLSRRSLFSEIPELRTCADAGIEEKYCTCKEKTFVSSKTPLAQTLARQLVTGINHILTNVSNVCATLDVDDVTEVSVTYSNIDELNLPVLQRREEKKRFFPLNLLISPGSSDTYTGRYNVLFHTIPGRGFFEGTIDYAQYGKADDKYTLIGDPSRLDRYGNQSHCVQDSFLKLYCYCKTLL